MIKIVKEHIGFTAVYFGYFMIEYIPQEVLNKIKDKSITHNIFRIQDDKSIMCGFGCIVFMEYMLAGKTLLDYTNLFSPNDYKKNDKIINKYFNDKYDRRNKSRVQIKKIDETSNYLLDEIQHNDLLSGKYKKPYKYSNYVEHLLILVSTVTSCISISAFASLVCVPVGITVGILRILQQE